MLTACIGFFFYMGIFISAEKPGLIPTFCKKYKPYFDRSREMGGSFWRKETNDFLCHKMYMQQTIDRVLNIKWNKQWICKSSKRDQCSDRWKVYKSKMHM